MKDPYYLHDPFFITNYDFFTFGTDCLLYFSPQRMHANEIGSETKHYVSYCGVGGGKRYTKQKN